VSLPDDGVTITLKDVYLLVQDVQKSVAVVPEHGTHLADLETRVRALERWRYSAHAALGVSASSLVTAVTAILTHR
jgi:hypothetical protein